MKPLWLPRAARDLDEIWEFSFRRWGPERADHYLRRIEAKAAALARGELSGTKADDVRPRLRRLVVRSHVIWFRVERDRVRVVRVLHQSRDAGVWIG